MWKSRDDIPTAWMSIEKRRHAFKDILASKFMHQLSVASANVIYRDCFWSGPPGEDNVGHDLCFPPLSKHLPTARTAAVPSFFAFLAFFPLLPIQSWTLPVRSNPSQFLLHLLFWLRRFFSFNSHSRLLKRFAPFRIMKWKFSVLDLMIPFSNLL